MRSQATAPPPVTPLELSDWSISSTSMKAPSLSLSSLSLFRQGNGVEDCSPTPRASAPPTVAGGHGGKRLCWQGPQPSRAKYLVKRDEGGTPANWKHASVRKEGNSLMARKRGQGAQEEHGYVWRSAPAARLMLQPRVWLRQRSRPHWKRGEYILEMPPPAKHVSGKKKGSDELFSKGI